MPSVDHVTMKISAHSMIPAKAMVSVMGLRSAQIIRVRERPVMLLLGNVNITLFRMVHHAPRPANAFKTPHVRMEIVPDQLSTAPLRILAKVQPYAIL